MSAIADTPETDENEPVRNSALDAPSDEPEAPERPSWLPAKFDSPEAMAASYAESHRKISQQGAQIAELLRENEALLAELDSQENLAGRIQTLERRYLAALAGASR